MNEAEARFAGLVDEWQAVLVRTAEKSAAMRSQVHTEWTTAIAEMSAERGALRAAGRWVGGPDDLLAVVGMHRNELVHSAAVAWILDPRMRHGFGVEFLRRFLLRCFPDEKFAGLESARCEREIQRAQARVDILIWADEWMVLVENKVDAAEQPDQCDTYHHLFGDETGAHFVFLSPTGRSPYTATGDAAGAFRSLSYRAIRDDLRATLAATATNPATTGRSSAAAYLATLESQFP